MKKLLIALLFLPFPAWAFPDEYSPRRIFGGEVILTSVATPSTIDFGVQSRYVNVCAQVGTGASIFLKAKTIAASQDFVDVADVATFKTGSFTVSPLTATGGDGCTGWFPLRTRTMQVLLDHGGTAAATVDFMVLPR